RSNDGGASWETVGNEFVYEGVPGTHHWYDGTPHPWEFARVWHLEPSRTDPDSVYAGVEDAALFHSSDGGMTWQELAGLRGHGSGKDWQPGAGGMCLHTILVDPSDSEHYVAEGKLRVYRSRTGGHEWEALTHGLPQRDCYVNVLRDAMAVDSFDPCGVYFGTSGGQVYASADAGDHWTAIVRDLPP